MQEVWVPVLGFDGYEVSDQGRYRSLDRIITYMTPQAQTPITKKIKGRILRPTPEYEKDYEHKGPKRYRVALCKEGKHYTFFLHRLVLEGFRGPKPDGMECSHINGDGTDNRLENLEYEDHAQNCARRTDHGTQAQGESNHFAKLTEADVIAIRSLKGKQKRDVIAEMFGIVPSTVSDIHHGRTWSHL